MTEKIMTEQTCKRPLSEKYALSIVEASEYFGIGISKMRRLAAEHMNDGFATMSGNRYLIVREKFEEFLVKTSAI